MVVMGLIILFLIANFRYLLWAYFQESKSYMLFYRVGHFFFNLSVQITTRRRRNSSKVGDPKKASSVSEKNGTFRGKPKRKSNSSSIGKFLLTSWQGIFSVVNKER